MSYIGARFPEGIDPQKYIEIISVGSNSDILASCPHLRQAVQQLLSADTDTSLPCPGCGTPDVARIIISIDTERMFVLRHNPCIQKLENKTENSPS
jgi:hypothetical protein